MSDLTQEETDLLTRHLLDTQITDVTVYRVLKKLGDIEDGAGTVPDDWRPTCKKCDEEIDHDEVMGTAFGHFYHRRCVPTLKDPMLCGQWLGGVENAV